MDKKTDVLMAGILTQN